MVYFKGAFYKVAWGGLHEEALKRVCCRILSRLGYGADPNEEHAMKRKSGKRKSGKCSFKPLEISFSWFKVVFLMKR
ncbi:hypothetical protein VN0806_07100 [Helicobacter pylori]